MTKYLRIHLIKETDVYGIYGFSVEVRHENLS